MFHPTASEVFQLEIFHQNYFEKTPFSLKDTGISHRLITYWDEKGLLGERKKDDKWRKFNLIDLIWLRLIAKLRSFNIGIETIKDIRELLFTPTSFKELLPDIPEETIDAITKSGELGYTKEFFYSEESLAVLEKSFITCLEMLLIMMYLEKSQFSILLRLPEKEETGKIVMSLYSADKLLEFYKVPGYAEFFQKTHISISLPELFSDVLKVTDIQKLTNEVLLLTKEEMDLIHHVRSKKYSTIKIRFDKKQELDMLELTIQTKLENEARILDIIQTKGYQDIELKTEKGKVVMYKNTKKIKLK